MCVCVAFQVITFVAVEDGKDVGMFVCLLTAKNHVNRLTLARSSSETGGKEGKNG